MTIESNTDIENERFQPEADGEIPVEAPEAVAAPPPTPPTRRRPTIRLAPADMVAGLLLIVVIVAGGYFRNLGYNWDDYTHLHPDERFLSGVTDAIGGPLNPTGDQQSQDKQRADCLLRYPAPPDHPEMAGAATSIFDTECSTYYPPNAGNGLYVYGELPLFVVKATAYLVQQQALSNAQSIGDPVGRGQAIQSANYVTTYYGVQVVGRMVSTLAELFSIFFVFLIGRRLYNRWTGLLAAALYAAAVLPIQLSHFWTADAFTNLPVVITFWFATRILDRARWYDFLGAGVALGASFASRINTLPLFGVVVLAAMIYALPYLAGATVRVDWWKVLRRSLVSLVFIAIIVFLLLLMNHVLANFGLPDAAQKILLGAGIVALALIYLFFVSPAINFNPLPGRAWLWQRLLLGCLVAFIATLVTFRFAYPHAFTGGPGLLGFFNITPYSTFLNNMSEAQRLTSGAVDFPPAHQWANRAPYLFALDNIVLWGLGVPLGLMAWFGFLWAALQVLRARPGWTRHVLPVAWIAVYFGYMGRQWVMTMRYFMPIYPFLALMAAWALVEIAVRAWRWSAENGAVLRRAAAVGGTLLLVGVLVLTYVWADMFVSIYRRELTRVEASRWVQREAPSPVSTTLTTSDGQTRLVNLRLPGGAAVTVTAYDTPAPRLVAFTPQAVGSIDHVIISHLADPDHKGDVKRFNVTVALNNDGSKVIAHGSIQANFGAQASSLGDPVTVRLDQPVMLNPTEQYYFMTWSEGRLSVVRTATDLADFTVADGQGNAVAQVKLPEQADTRQASAYLSGQPLDANFSAPLDGMIDHFDLTHALNPLRDGSTVNLNISLYDATSNTLLSQGTLSADISTTKSSPDGDAYRIPLDKPVTVKAGQALRFEIAASGQEPVQIAGTAIASEGPWDDPIPWKVCPLPADMPLTHDTPPNVLPITCDSVDGFDGWYRGLALNMADEDDQTKQASIQSALDQADYFIISSNRFYDSEARIPMRYPMSIAFYKALFAGQTGFDLVKTVSSFPSLGSFEIPDQNLPIYNTPSWVKEFQSEEAFSVYDHPTVFIFKKNANYSSQALAKILNVPNATIDQVSLREDTVSSQDPTLVNRITFSAADPGPALNGFQLTDDQRAIQTQGGTWSDLFNRNWTINTSPIIAVVAWWLAILLIGLAAWPLVFVVLPGLPDRGYPIAKIIGLLIVAWVAWAGGTLHLLTWTQGGLFLITLALIAVGIVLAWRHREAMRDYVRANWRHMLIVELITLILFLAFVFVRLGNPDLWAQVLGGEKPMDFAYFNAVLRSTIFPPYDPWYAGGYLNYYYFGYVLIGSPVKLLGVMPSIAYNLVVPTLFALTGIGAFCVAFNLAASRIFFPRDEGQDGGQDVPLRARRRFAMRVPAASPYLAGALALILCLILGNLDTPRTFIGGVTQAGGYAQDTQAFLNWKIQQFTKANGHQPSADEMLLLTGEASNPSVPDQIGFALSDTGRLLSSISGGIVSIARGGILPVDPNRWFWAARSVVGEMPNSSNEINEFPYFTFVYGDLHAHMMAFPLTLLALAWLLSEVLGAGYIRRTTALSIGVALLGGLIVGALQATNTWDWLTYFLLGILGLFFAMWLRRNPLCRQTLVGYAGQIVTFVAASGVFALPFTTYWATAYLGSNAIQSFTGTKTPIWAYLDMNGIFIFILVSFLIWQTARLLRRVYVRDLAGRGKWLVLLVAAIGLTLLAAIFMTVAPLKIWLFSLPIPLALLCLPLFVWCGILFLMPDQSRELRVIYALTGLALAISLGVEVVVLGADIGRQNTFFKFYLQIWMLLSVCAGVALAWLLTAAWNWRPVTRVLWLTATALLLALGGLYPIMSTQGKIAMRMAFNAPHSLDGDAYMPFATYYEGSVPIPMADDLKMIRWFQDNVSGTPVILETHEYPSEYKWDGRISINTGLPTILGWRFHQQQQRTVDPLPNLVVQRALNVSAMYNNTDVPTVWNMLQFYHVQYIVVGKLERAVFAPEGLAKFDQMAERGLLKVVYENAGDHIYYVVPGASLPAVNVGG